MDVDGGEGGGTASARRPADALASRAAVAPNGPGCSDGPQCAAQAGEEKVHEQHDGLRAQKRPSPGERPAPLLEVRPQGKLQRHAGIGCDVVQNLDVLAPQMVDQLPDILLFFAALSLVPEQVTEVPKILPDDVPMRTTVRDTQLVEVPTIISFSSLQRTLEQNVDIPVPHPAGRIAGLQGFHPEQSSNAAVFQETLF